MLTYYYLRSLFFFFEIEVIRYKMYNMYNCNNLFPLQKPLGILSILDEESRFPKATDKSLATKLHSSSGEYKVI